MHSKPAGAVRPDCRVTTNPVALLLVVTGRLPAAASIALGLLRLAGHRPELALGTNPAVFP